jgi:hypothetical protein
LFALGGGLPRLIPLAECDEPRQLSRHLCKLVVEALDLLQGV